MSDKRIDALKSAAAKKKQNALDKTEKAIQTLIEKNHKITISSVAREAGVSTSYIYKYPELIYRIQVLKEQQKYNRVKPEVPSSKSHQIIATQLRNRIKIVQQEKEELIKEIEVLAANVYEMSKSENSRERLKAENIRLLAENQELKRRLKYLENQIGEQRDFLLKEGYKNKYDDLDSNPKEPRMIRVVSENENTFPAILPGQSIAQTDVIDEKIQKLLSKAGITLSKTTIELIKSKSKEQVINAINVVIDKMNTGVHVRSKVRLFRNALEEQWIPHESSDKKIIEQH